MKPVRLAVIGTGHLGRIHARLASSLENVQLIGVVDPAPEARQRCADEAGTRAFSDHRQILSQIDAAVVATPTTLHHSVAGDLLDAGIHVLVEKPITPTVAEADALVRLAAERQCVLQVGHVERFNAAFQAVRHRLGAVKYVAAARCSGFTGRSVDIGVVLDLMIHDLDLVMAMANSPIVDVQALGLTIFGPHEDMAHAHLTFANGCVATLDASRTSYANQRGMQIFGSDGFAQLDFANGQATLVKPHPRLLSDPPDVAALSPAQQTNLREHLFEDYLTKQTLETTPVNAILEEQREFVCAIQHGAAVQVTGQQARDVLAVTERIIASIQQHRWNGQQAGPIGPRFWNPASQHRRAG